MTTRVGFGYDVHAFTEGRPLVLGGVTIPYEYGLAGHSDADTVIHAIVDALLGFVMRSHKCLWVVVSQSTDTRGPATQMQETRTGARAAH